MGLLGEIQGETQEVWHDTQKALCRKDLYLWISLARDAFLESCPKSVCLLVICA